MYIYTLMNTFVKRQMHTQIYRYICHICICVDHTQFSNTYVCQVCLFMYDIYIYAYRCMYIRRSKVCLFKYPDMYIYILMYTFEVCLFKYPSMFIQVSRHVYLYINVYVCICVHICVDHTQFFNTYVSQVFSFMYLYMYIYILYYLYMYDIYIYVHRCMYICRSTCVCIYTCTSYIHICTIRDTLICVHAFAAKEKRYKQKPASIYVGV